jgi:hypothetical protein
LIEFYSNFIPVSEIAIHSHAICLQRDCSYFRLTTRGSNDPRGRNPIAAIPGYFLQFVGAALPKFSSRAEENLGSVARTNKTHNLYNFISTSRKMQFHQRSIENRIAGSIERRRKNGPIRTEPACRLIQYQASGNLIYVSCNKVCANQIRHPSANGGSKNQRPFSRDMA